MRTSLVRNMPYQERDLPALEAPRSENRYKQIEVTSLEIAKITLVVMQMLTELVRLIVEFMENLDRVDSDMPLNVPSFSFHFPNAAPRLLPAASNPALRYEPLQIEGA
jgi:hypothetical protein